MPQYGTAWIDVRGNTEPLAADINRAVSKGASFLASGTKTVLGDVGRSAAQLSAGFVALGAAGATSLAKIGAGYNSLEQSSLAAFKTLLGTQQAAEEMQANLREFAKSSPFPRQAFIEGTQRLLAFGVEAKKVIPYLDGIQDAIAAAGGNATDLSGVVESIAKIRSAAAFTVRDLMELGNRGINAAKLIASQRGMTEQEFRDSIFGAPLRGADAIKALDDLIAGMKDTYGGAAAGLKNTWVGAIDRIKGAWRDLGSGIMDPFISKSGGGSAVDSANALADSLRAIEKNILPVIVPLSDLLGKHLLDAATSAADFVKAISPTQAASKLNQLIGVTEKARVSLRGLEGVATGVGVAIAGIGARSVLGPLGFLVPSISPITGALAGLVLGSKESRDALASLAREAGRFVSTSGRDLTEGLGRFAEQLAGPVGRLIENFGKGLLNVGRTVIPVLVNGLDQIGPPLGRFIDATGELISKVLPQLASLLSTGVSAALPAVTAALSAAATAAEFLADNAWLVVPALSAIAAVKIASAIGNIGSVLSAAGEGAKALVAAVQQAAATRGVSTMAAGFGVAKASAGELAGTLVGGLNPAVLGVTAAVVAGGAAYFAWKKNQDQVAESAKNLSNALLEQGDVIETTVRMFQAQMEMGKDTRNAWDKTGFSMRAISKLVLANVGDMDKARQVFNEHGHSVKRLSENLDKVPESVRPAIKALTDMVASGQIRGDEFIHVLNAMVDLDKGAQLTTKNLRSMGQQFKATLADMKQGLSSDLRKDLEIVLNSDKVEEQRAALGRLAAAMPNVAANAGIFIDATGELRGKVEAAALSTEDAAAMLRSYGDATKDAKEASTGAGAEIELTQENVDGLAASLEEASQKATELAAALLELSGGQRDVAAAEVAAYDALNSVLDGAQERLSAVAEAQERVNEAQAALTKAQQEGGDVGAAQKQLTKAQADLAKATAAASNSLDRTTEAGGKNWQSIAKVIEQWEALAKAQALVDPTGKKSTATLQALNLHLRDLRNKGIIPTDEALAELRSTFALDEGGIKLKVQADVADALTKIGDVKTKLGELPGGADSAAILADVQVLVDQGKYQEAAQKLMSLPGVYETEKAVVDATADQAGLETTKKQIDSVALDRSLLIRMDLDTALAEKKAKEFAERIQSAWSAFNLGQSVTFGELVGLKGQRASGGRVTPGRWLVGEHGPEILELGTAGQVYDAVTTRRMLDGKGQSGVQFTESQLRQLADAVAQRSALDINVTADTDDGRRIGQSVADMLWLRGL